MVIRTMVPTSGTEFGSICAWADWYDKHPKVRNSNARHRGLLVKDVDY